MPSPGGDPQVEAILERLHGSGLQAYVVGGAVRDALLGRPPHDVDVATDATPDEVVRLFPGAVADDAAFGRVLVDGVDILTLRRDGVYRDRRHPSSVEFTASVEEDLARRDFTVNAMAWRHPDGALLDPWGGRRDLRRRVLRAVGDPASRFAEDALRMLRGVRLAAELGFRFARPTWQAMVRSAGLLEYVSAERVRDELSRLLVAPHAARALEDLRRAHLLPETLPELVPAVGCPQHTPNHDRDVWGHTVGVVGAIAPELHLRLAALLHDCGKPATRTRDPGGRDHFYRHEQVGAELAAALLRRLRFPRALEEHVVLLVRHHMFHFPPGSTLAAARRFLHGLGAPEAVPELLELRRADRAASRAGPGLGYSADWLAEAVQMIEAEGHAFRLSDLAIDGHDVMAVLEEGPGRRIGAALQACFEHVLDHPEDNRREVLLERVRAWAAAEPGE